MSYTVAYQDDIFRLPLSSGISRIVSIAVWSESQGFVIIVNIGQIVALLVIFESKLAFYNKRTRKSAGLKEVESELTTKVK